VVPALRVRGGVRTSIRAAPAAYVGIKRGDAEIHPSEHTGDIATPGLRYIWVDAVDPLAALSGTNIDEMPWARDFEIADPDGNRLRFAKPVAG